MKIFYLFLVALFTSFISIGQVNYSVYVQGYVTNANGGAVNNQPVYIYTDSSNGSTGCLQNHVKYTNPNGFYNDTLYCTGGAISILKISTPNCNGTVLTNTVTVPPTRFVESNFMLCSPTPTCLANFSFQISGNTAYFVNQSTASGSAVAQYLWSFGDGSSSSLVSPVHTYSNSGVYTVMLTMVSGNGCRDSVIRAVSITGQQACHASFLDSVFNNKVYFFSGASSVAQGDSIISRTWYFGDPNSNTNVLTGNAVNAYHIYPNSSLFNTYNVCLVIRTASGCKDSICKAVVINPVTSQCVARFTTTTNPSAGNVINFNSSTSEASTGDSITMRYWTFGDGSSGSGVSPVHTYANIGNYTVCLYIGSASGCRDTVCSVVQVSNQQCQSYFVITPSTSNNRLFQFNSSSSTPTSITSRIWSFGDGDSLGGNVISPSHTYTNAGTYNVCLKILSSNGCTNTFCKTLVVTNPTTQCLASFTSTIVSTSPYAFTFNSSGSQTAFGDSINERYWTFGDGLSGVGVVNTHTYTTGGSYIVCLYIISQSGCRDTICQVIQVPNSTCQSYFVITPSTANNRLFQFNSASSSPSSSIISRVWSFGDGETLGGNVIDPTHTYLNAGTYTICLKITTANNCTNTLCKTITIANPTNCTAYFNYLNNGSVYTLHSYPQTGAGDSVIRHIWYFGDGDTLAGNNAIPTHTYSVGTYQVCLKIITASGCTSNYCRSLVVATDSTCKAVFTFSSSSPTDRLINFFSGTSSTTPGTAITTRIWSFGDGDSLSGNLINVQHVYSGAGTYNVCLTIISPNGCTNKVCKTVTISKFCKAKFTVSPSPTVPPIGNDALFNSSTSEVATGDSIISRTWLFGDGTSLGGNVVSPIHNFVNSGTYTVCLIIGSAKGCGDSTCKTVVVPFQNACVSYFTASPSILNAKLFYFNSANSSSSSGTVITTRIWSFGDGDSLSGNVVDPQHLYVNAGTYNVCLRIISANGTCEDTFCKTITIAPTHCQAKLTVTGGSATPIGYQVQFNSNVSMAVSGDSIVERTWKFGDGTGLTGNVVAPSHTYTASGNYYACLIIRTASGCKDSACIVVAATVPVQYPCAANFSFSTSGNTVRLMSNAAEASTGDSITTRLWSFGDSTYLQGNVANPSHTYRVAGTYVVCLKIITAKGCNNTTCKTIVVTNVNTSCVAYFTAEKLNNTLLSMRFNSMPSLVSAGDSIVTRTWNFGDGSPVVTGNIANIAHNYLNSGTYNVCLRISTRFGCVNEVCLPVKVGDSTIVVDTTDPIRILLLAPNPVGQQFSTVVWSRFNNVNAEYAIYDIYGVRKWSMRKVLQQGNNISTLPSYFLLPGPYFLRVTTIYGIRTRKFFKM